MYNGILLQSDVIDISLLLVIFIYKNKEYEINRKFESKVCF